MTSTKRTARTVRTKRKPYVPSEEQRAEDERLRKQLHDADMEQFDKIFDKANWMESPKSSR